MSLDINVLDQFKTIEIIKFIEDNTNYQCYRFDDFSFLEHIPVEEISRVLIYNGYEIVKNELGNIKESERLKRFLCDKFDFSYQVSKETILNKLNDFLE